MDINNADIYNTCYDRWVPFVNSSLALYHDFGLCIDMQLGGERLGKVLGFLIVFLVLFWFWLCFWFYFGEFWFEFKIYVSRNSLLYIKINKTLKKIK